jgi:hypothetical protein
MKIGTTILQGQTENPVVKGNYPTAGKVTNWDGYVNANFGDGDAGGMMRLFTPSSDYQPTFTFWWWRPIPMLRVQLGRNADGDWGHAQIAGWGFNAEAQGGVALDEWRGLNGTAALVARNANGQTAATNPTGQWAGGFSGWGATLTLTPIPGLLVGLAIPFGEAAANWQTIYSKIYLHAQYALPDIGTARLAVQFAPGYNRTYIQPQEEVKGEVEPKVSWRGNTEAADMTQIWGSFYLSMIEGLGAEVSLSYKLPYTREDVNFVDGEDKGVKYKYNVGGAGIVNGLPPNARMNYPVALGIGARYAVTPDINVKLRFGMNFGGSSALVDPEASRKLMNEKAQNIKNEEAYNQLVAQGNSQAEIDAWLADHPILWSHIPDDMFIPSDTYYEEIGGTWVGRSGTQIVKGTPVVWGVGILPSYKIGNLTVFLNAGIGAKHYGKQTVLTAKLDAEGAPVKDDNGDTVYESVEFTGKPGIYYTEKVIGNGGSIE